jgi:signal transduction histidine kinase
MKRRPAAGLFTGMKRPVREALDLILPRWGRIAREWRQMLRQLELSRAEYDVLARLNLRALSRHLKAGEYDAFRGTAYREGRTLALQGVPEEDTIMAIGFFLESCLASRRSPIADRKMLALVRVVSAIQRLILSGYSAGRAAGGRADDRERYRLSRDLHDEVGADLVLLKLCVEMIAMNLAKGNLREIAPKLGEAQALISRAIESIRRLTLDLGPAMLEQLGFMPAVRTYARQFSARTGIPVEVQERQLPDRIPLSHETALYRVLRGALSNVAEHACATKVKCAVGGMRNSVVVMVIEDDGVGFDVQSLLPERAFGLTAMRDRIQSLSGRIHIDSRRAGPYGRRSGTRIEIDLPLLSGPEP